VDRLNAETIKRLALEVGFHVCGITLPATAAQAGARIDEWAAQGKHGNMSYLEDFARRSEQFWSEFPEAKSVIVLGLNYYSNSSTGSVNNGGLTSPTDLGSAALKGRVARYAWGKDYHWVIKEKLEILKKQLTAHAGKPVRFHSAIDTKPLAERDLAEKAGLGFIGKQTQLLSLQYGPWLFLSELVTDLDLEPDMAFEGSCGTCQLCIDVCPTEAIEEDKALDARKCIAYLTIENKEAIPSEFRDKIGHWVFGCDDCLNICPFTNGQQETDCRELTAAEGFGPHLNLENIFDLASQGVYEKQFKGTAILRARHKQLLRNACVVLGNSNDRSAIPVLKKALKHGSKLVREHAEWALQKLGG